LELELLPPKMLWKMLLKPPPIEPIRGAQAEASE
jgi:hypothetical protein